MARIELAMAVAFLGHLEEAVVMCGQVVEVCADHGERWARAYALYVLGYAAWHAQDLGRARALLSECLVIDHAFHDLLGTVLALELMALVAVDGGDPAEAAVLQGAAEGIWPSVGLPLFGSACFNAAHVLCEERARGRLGDPAYETFRTRGRGLGLDAAVARALAGTDETAREAPPARDAPAPETRGPAASRSVRSEGTAGRSAER